MNIGIIVYSQTGNTLAVAERIKETCIAAGHTAEIGRITVESPEKADAAVKLLNIPAVGGYDAVILGAPVQAFSLCRQMTAYLKQMQSVKGLPVACFILQGLPKKWMGGNRAYKTMRSLCMRKGADPVRIGHVHWRSNERDAQIADTVSAALKFAATLK
jgi:flavodoxin